MLSDSLQRLDVKSELPVSFHFAQECKCKSKSYLQYSGHALSYTRTKKKLGIHDCISIPPGWDASL